MRTYVFTTEHFDGRTVRTVIDGSFTPPAIFFEELVGHDRLGETSWRDFHAESIAWEHFTACLIKGFLRMAAKGDA